MVTFFILDQYQKKHIWLLSGMSAKTPCFSRSSRTALLSFVLFFRSSTEVKGWALFNVSIIFV